MRRRKEINFEGEKGVKNVHFLRTAGAAIAKE